MKTFKTIYPTQPAARRAAFTVSSTATGCAILLMAAGAPAFAADEPAGTSAADTAPLEEVVVTGIRAAIESAIAEKKNSDSIVEAVSAEDIGKLPDTSIAESLARLPGLAAQRTNGRATGISVRGFAPDFSTALLNGREQVSTGDSRFVEFDQYPSELLSGVTVYKTPDGGLIGQGLSATIDMKTVRPLEFGKRAFAVNYRKEQLGKGLSTPSGDGSRVNLSYVDQFADRTLGLAVGYARLKETSGTTQNFGSWGVNDVCPVANNNGCPVATIGRAPGGFNDLVDKTHQLREALMGTLQYKPNENFESTFDAFYTKFDINLLEQGVQAPLLPAYPEWGQNYDGDSSPTYITPTTITNGVITAGTFSGFKGVSRNDSTATHDKIYSYGWNNSLKMDVWTATLDLATSEAKRKSANTQTTAGLPGNCNTTPAACGSISWTGFDGNSVTSATYTATPSLSDATVMQLTDVEGWGGNLVNGASTTPQAGYSSQPLTDDKLDAFRLSAKRDLGSGQFFSNVDFGLNYADRTKDRTYIEGRLLVGDPSSPFAAVPVPGGTVATAPGSGLTYLAWNPDGSIGSVYTVASKLVADIANKNWTVHEKVTTAYVKLNIEHTLFGLPVRGNAGLQVVNTDQSSTARSVDGAACPLDVCNLSVNTDGAKYNDVLPSLNLVADLGSGQDLRLGLARQMARPTLNDMRASLQFNVDNQQGILTGSAGNPRLKPFRATALDVSYEKYFGKQGYLSAALFYKDLSTYIIREFAQFDFAPYVNAQTPLPVGGSTIGQLTRPVNGTGGRIDGIELSASIPFSLMTSWLEGFGVQASYSYTDSSVKLPISGLQVQNITLLTIPLPGLSKTVDQITLYYERYGFSARVGQRHRSDFIGTITDFKGDNQLVFVKSERITDVQLGYELHSGPVKGLSLLLQANNINNAPYIEYQDTPSNEKTHVNYGKTYLFGVNYRF
ncbi:MAG TPA: TonB-dependent receptor [Steroidobacteraceae bacterium]|nr:TonB-dependent receptor [Steroidobacteraceae bacterium]